jgi:hypothetical protein
MKIRKILLSLRLIPAIVTLLALLLAFASCGQTSSNDITLNLQIGSGVGTDSPSYDETDSMVIRCLSFTESGNQLTAQASKQMSLKPDTLIFIEDPLKEVTGGGAQIVVVPVTGKENEYDMAQARSYIVTKASAETVLKENGIEYAIWYSGAVSGAEKFDCCD